MPNDDRQLTLFQCRAGAAVLSLVVLALAALCGRLVAIQIDDDPRVRDLAARQQRGRIILPARRGCTYDARGRCVAGSRSMKEVFVDPAMVADVDRLAAELAARLDEAPAELAARIRAAESLRYLKLADHLTDEEAEAFRSLRPEGVGIAEHQVRTYPLGDSMCHVLGIVGRDRKGLEALELQYDDHLRGRDGVCGVVRSAGRKALGWGDERIEPMDGGDLYLTLDSEIQRILETELDGALARFHAESAVGIVMDPFSGDVVALACRPGFDPNRYADFPADLRRNRALTDPVEPGSVFKPFIAPAALMTGVVRADELIDCHNGLHWFGRRPIHDTHPQGLLDLKGIIVHSSNIGMGLIGQRLGNAAMHQMVRSFGFGALTGIDLPGESIGIVPPLKEWNSYSTTSVPIGQELAVTPIQLITAFSSVVNGGFLLSPRVVRSLVGPDGGTLKADLDPPPVRRVLPPDVARRFAQDILPAVVEEGADGNLRLDDYTMLGKTGTAQVPRQGAAGYEPDAYLSSFVAAGPVARPRLAVLVMIRKPDRAIGYYGRTVAGPAAGRILQQSLRYLNVPPDRPGLAGTLAPHPPTG